MALGVAAFQQHEEVLDGDLEVVLAVDQEHGGAGFVQQALVLEGQDGHDLA